MRRRRVDRCLLRAEAALKAGRFAEARDAVEEVRRLVPDDPRIPEIEGGILTAESASLRTAGRRLGRPLRAAAAVVVAVTAGTAAFVLSRDAQNTGGAATDPVAVALHAGPIAERPADRNVRIQHQHIVAREMPAPFAPAPEPRAEPEAEREPPPPPPPLPQPVARAETPQPAPAPLREPEPRPAPARDIQTARLERAPAERAPTEQAAAGAALPTTSDSPGPIGTAGTTVRPPTVAALEVRETTEPVTPAPSREPAAREAAAPVIVPEVTDVRAVLARFEAAYSGLNADAASAIWPQVDRRALARAFEQLAAQKVSLGDCDVRVTGTTARAECLGTSTWTPRIGGGGPRTEARQWTFSLRKAGEQWRIEQALAQAR